MLGHTEYFDDQNTLIPQPDDLPNEPSFLDLNTETTPLEVVAPKTKAIDSLDTLKEEDVPFDTSSVEDEDLDYFKSLAETK